MHTKYLHARFIWNPKEFSRSLICFHIKLLAVLVYIQRTGIIFQMTHSNGKIIKPSAIQRDVPPSRGSTIQLQLTVTAWAPQNKCFAFLQWKGLEKQDFLPTPHSFLCPIHCAGPGAEPCRHSTGVQGDKEKQNCARLPGCGISSPGPTR